MKLELASSVLRETTAFQAKVSISPNGDKVFAAYLITVDKVNTLIAELFQNQNGNMVSFKTLKGDLEFSAIDSGIASPDFSKFTVLDDNQSTDASKAKARLRLFDNNLNLLGERIFDDAYLPGYTFVGGSFSEDSRAFILSYVVKDGENQKSIIRIIKADENLRDIAVLRFEGISTGQTLFTHGCDLYVTFVTAEGKLNFDDLATAAKPQYKLHVYKLEGHVLVSVARAKLPQFSYNAPSVLIKDEHVNILVGTLRAIKDDQVNIYENNTSYECDNKHDCAELRIYRFTGCELVRLYTNKRDHTVQSPILHPDARHLVFANENANIAAVNSNQPGFWQVSTLNHLYEIIRSRLPYASPHLFNAKFSDNGKWLIIGGASDNQTCLNNVQLWFVDQVLDCQSSSASSTICP